MLYSELSLGEVEDMSDKKMTWKEIEKKFDRQWVQLVNYDWPEE